VADVTNVDPKLINPSNAIVNNNKEDPITLPDHILKITLALKIAMSADKLDISQGFLFFLN